MFDGAGRLGITIHSSRATAPTVFPLTMEGRVRSVVLARRKALEEEERGWFGTALVAAPAWEERW